MRVAHIVPTPLLPQYGTVSDYHLILAHAVLEDKTYAEFYRERSEAGDFIILDNGAFEFGKAIDFGDVLAAARTVKPTEIVMPDVLRDRNATVRNFEAAYRLYDSNAPVSEDYFQHPQEQWMVVPQGEDYVDWMNCYDELRDRIDRIVLTDESVTFGLFEELADWDLGGRPGVLSMLHNTHRCAGTYHLLGFQERMLPEMRELQEFSCVRGTDSGKGFSYGYYGMEVDTTLSGYPGRPKDYFNIKDDPFPNVVRHNLEVINRAATGQE